MASKVKVELSPYDLNRGRITYRHRSWKYARQSKSCASAAAWSSVTGARSSSAPIPATSRGRA